MNFHPKKNIYDHQNTTPISDLIQQIRITNNNSHQNPTTNIDDRQYITPIPDLFEQIPI